MCLTVALELKHVGACAAGDQAFLTMATAPVTKEVQFNFKEHHVKHHAMTVARGRPGLRGVAAVSLAMVVSGLGKELASAWLLV